MKKIFKKEKWYTALYAFLGKTLIKVSFLSSCLLAMAERN